MLRMNKEQLSQITKTQTFAFVRGEISMTGATDYLIVKYMANHYNKAYLVGYYKDEYVDKRICLVHIPFKNLPFPFVQGLMLSILASFRLIRKKPKVVLWEWIYFLPGGILFKFLNKNSKLVIDVRSHPLISRGSFVEKLYESMFQMTFAVAEHIVDGFSFITRSMFAYVKVRYSIHFPKNKPVLFWGSGYDDELFEAARKYIEKRPELLNKIRNCLGIPSDSRVLLYYGTLHSSRLNVLLTIIEAVSRLKSEGFNVSLLIIGEGDGRGFIDQVIKERKLSQYIILKSAVSHIYVPFILSAADIVLAPFPLDHNWYTQFPLKIAEALGMKKPVVTTPLSELKHLLPREFIIESFNSKAIKMKIMEILSMNPDKLRLAYESINQRISWKSITLQLYQQLVSV